MTSRNVSVVVYGCHHNLWWQPILRTSLTRCYWLRAQLALSSALLRALAMQGMRSR